MKVVLFTSLQMTPDSIAKEGTLPPFNPLPVVVHWGSRSFLFERTVGEGVDGRWVARSDALREVAHYVEVFGYALPDVQ